MANVNPSTPNQAPGNMKSAAELYVKPESLEALRASANNTTSFSYAAADIITVNVGPNKVAYGLHRGILVSGCPFFEKCLRSGMREAQEKTVNLPEEQTEAFDILVRWMYSGRIALGGAKQQERFIDAYLLADKFCMHALQNAIMDALRKACKPFDIWPETLHCVWKNSTGNCKLRKFCFDFVYFTLSNLRIWHGTHLYITASKVFREQMDELMQSGSPVMNALFWKLADSGMESSRMTGELGLNPASLSGCFYHAHKDGEKCKSSG
ncbi:hypothetical protein PV05_01749 [Exophiala xenobiotica]|uniref:BTB domain-containing protein n=1 Tax=Exophiala xenobiotica TaxID=348802 RepID=A0A0D2F3U7_9EURO|nr:uncharacterized protein PV05_01749 [Exophiala xenobiotica]KIW61650.1 hypothetical protein PV05_01749 [Exophiala xenobiotica]